MLRVFSAEFNMWGKCLVCFVLYNSIVDGQMIFPDSKLLFSNEMSSHDSKYTLYNSNLNNIYTNSLNMDGVQKMNHISHGLNSFALNINKQMLNSLKEPINENVVLSPLSIAGALSLLTLGSIGKTYDELAGVLGFFNELSLSKNVHQEFGQLLNKINDKNQAFDSAPRNLSYGNALFLQKNYPIRQQYEDTVRNVYGSKLFQVDFQYDGKHAQEIINKWVYDQTKGKIQDIMNNIPSKDTRIIIASALYFNAEWEKHFITELTKKTLFIPDARFPEKSTYVDMMVTEGMFPYYKSEEYECVIVGLPYKGNKTTLYAIKPIDSLKKNLRQIMNDLTANALNMLIKNTEKQSTIVAFPKMKLTSTYNLKDVLQNMGVQSVFSDTDANLALMSQHTYVQPQYQNNNDYNQRLIFSRFGDTKNESNCAEIFQFKDSMVENCTSIETIDGKKFLVVYKRIGNQIGRKIIKRSNFNHQRIKRQIENNLNNPGLFVGEIVHKVDIDITEKGTEAAAATLAFVTRGGIRPVFRADEPFFFIIKDEETDLPLFSSTVYNP